MVSQSPPYVVCQHAHIRGGCCRGWGGGGSKYYDPDASPGAGPNRPPLDPLSRRGEIYLKTRGHPGGLLVEEFLRSRHSHKVTRVDQTETRNSFGVRFLKRAFEIIKWIQSAVSFVKLVNGFVSQHSSFRNTLSKTKLNNEIYFQKFTKSFLSIYYGLDGNKLFICCKLDINRLSSFF